MKNLLRSHYRNDTGLFSARAEESFHESGWTQLEAYPENSELQAIAPPFLSHIPEWAEAYDNGKSYHSVVRSVLGPEAEYLTDSEVDHLIERSFRNMSYEDAESFWKSLGQVAQAALPVLGGVVGSVVAPGVGTAIGSSLGGLAGNLVGNAVGGRQHAPSAPQPAPMPMPVPRTMPSPTMGTVPSSLGAQGSNAAGQLLSLINNPQLLSALTSALLGGKGAAPTGQPFGQLMGLLSRLAETAAAETASGESYHPRLAGESCSCVESTEVSADTWAERLARSVNRTKVSR
jgi:hypothetical protein